MRSMTAKIRIVGKILVDTLGEVFCMALDCVKKIDAGLEQIKKGLAWHYKKYQGEQTEEDKCYILKLN